MAENRSKTQKETDDERKARLEDEWARKLPCWDARCLQYADIIRQ